MYNKGIIIPGLIIFVVLMLGAVLWDGGEKIEAPKPEKPVGYKNCVRPVAYMTDSHMVLLNQWRDEALREGNREPVEVDGQFYERSLQNGCMHCHTSKKKFCDRCHVFASVYPYCWDCHLAPKEDMAMKEAR